MEQITVQTKDNAFIYVDCDDKGIIQELAEYFTFFVPGYKFMPQFRNKMWDGKVRLLNLRDQSIYAGLYKYIEAFCKERNIECTIIPSAKLGYNLPNVHVDVDMSFIDEYTLPFEPRDYQLAAVKHALENRKALMVSPTASGKSYIIYLMMRYFLDMSYDLEADKVLLIVPTTSLVKQMVGDFAKYSEHDALFDAEGMCHEIMAGKDKGHETKKIYVSTTM